MRRIDDLNEQFINLVIYGKTGTGKTSLGVTAPRPLILLSERQGLLHVRQAAARLGVPTPPTLLMESLEDYRMVLRSLKSAEPGKPFAVYSAPGEVALQLPEPPESVVLDSVTDAARIIVDEIRKQSPQTIGKDGLPVDSQRFWNVLQDRAQALIMQFRDVPAHTIFLALADDREVGPDEGPKVRAVTPAMPMRKLPDMLAAAVNAVGYSYRTEKRDGGKVSTSYAVAFAGPEHLMLKSCAPLRDREHPDIGAWISAIRNQVAISQVAPPRSSESMPEERAVPAVEDAAPAAAEPAPAPAPEPKTSTIVDVAAAAAAAEGKGKRSAKKAGNNG